MLVHSSRSAPRVFSHAAISEKRSDATPLAWSFFVKGTTETFSSSSAFTITRFFLERLMALVASGLRAIAWQGVAWADRQQRRPPRTCGLADIPQGAQGQEPARGMDAGCTASFSRTPDSRNPASPCRGPAGPRHLDPDTAAPSDERLLGSSSVMARPPSCPALLSRSDEFKGRAWRFSRWVTR